MEENIKERNNQAVNIINQTLKKDEVGVLFIQPDRKLNLPVDIKIVKMYPFDPVDYSNHWAAKIRLKKDF